MKRIFRYIWIIALLPGLAACNKWLDLQPQDGITKAEFWKTKEDVKAALTGIYSSLNNGGVEEHIFLWGELRGDMILPTSYADDDFRFVKNMNILSTNIMADWSDLYGTINDCNLLLDFAGNAKSQDPTFSDSLYNAYMGEALTVRSLLYFYLVRTFRDVPLKLTGSYRDTDIQPTPKSGADQVLQQLITDLTAAQQMVPDYHEAPQQPNETESVINKGRITRPAVTALLADVYLWNEQYDRAAAEADKILNSGRYRLIGRADLNIFNGGSSETIFEISHKNSAVNPLFVMAADTRKAFVVDNMFVNTDIFRPNLEGDLEARDSRGEGYLFNSGGGIEKFGTENPSYYNFQIYRISDIMLIKAEAANEQGRGAEALALLNTLRTERGALQATHKELDPGDSEGITQFIMEERARELAFEGKRWFDLLRLAKKENYSNLDVLTDLVSRTADVTVQQSAINKIQDPDSHYLPILETEIFKDPSLTQNPFYLQ